MNWNFQKITQTFTHTHKHRQLMSYVFVHIHKTILTYARKCYIEPLLNYSGPIKIGTYICTFLPAYMHTLLFVWLHRGIHFASNYVIKTFWTTAPPIFMWMVSPQRLFVHSFADTHTSTTHRVYSLTSIW